MKIDGEKCYVLDHEKQIYGLSAIITKPSQLGPMSHPSINNLYRVIVWRNPYDPEYGYTMCVGEGYMRMYSEDTLPIDIRMRMTAIDSFIEGMVAKGTVDPAILNEKQIHGSQTSIYNNHISSDLDEIGWRSSEYYCLIMTEEELMQYKGGIVP
jgi:hypothetical protein